MFSAVIDSCGLTELGNQSDTRLQEHFTKIPFICGCGDINSAFRSFSSCFLHSEHEYFTVFDHFSDFKSRDILVKAE